MLENWCNVHMHTHVGEIMHMCTQSGLAFFYKAKHEQLQNELPSQCGSLFSNSSNWSNSSPRHAAMNGIDGVGYGTQPQFHQIESAVSSAHLVDGGSQQIHLSDADGTVHIQKPFRIMYERMNGSMYTPNPHSTLTLHVTLRADGTRDIWWDDSVLEYPHSDIANPPPEPSNRNSFFRWCPGIIRGKVDTACASMCAWKMPCAAAAVAFVAWICVGNR